MSLKQYVALMAVGTVACWIAFWLVITSLDPTHASWLVVGFFYLTLFLALVGSFAIMGVVFRLYLLRHDAVFRQVMIAFRQAFSFSFLIIAALFLQHEQLLYWWNMVFLIGALTLIEFAVLLRQRRFPPL